MYFLINEGNVFDKYNEIWENTIKYNEKNIYLEDEGKINTKESFQCFYNIGISVISIDSVYREDENYYPKVFLEKYYVFLLKIF